LDQAAVERLDEIRATLEQYRHPGLTEKNLKLVRLVLTEGIWREVISLPNILMRQARDANDHAPVKAALTAQLAVAVAILTFAPIRLSNLVAIKLGENLRKPGGLNSPYWLVFPTTTSRIASISTSSLTRPSLRSSTNMCMNSDQC